MAKRPGNGSKTTHRLSYTAEREENLRRLESIVREYGPFRYRGVHAKRGRCACGGLAVTRHVFVGRRGKQLLLHETCARLAGLRAPEIAS